MSNQRTARSGQSGRRATNMEQTFKNASPGSLLGENVARLDATRFVSGRVDYSADLLPEGALHLAILRSALQAAQSPSPRAA